MQRRRGLSLAAFDLCHATKPGKSLLRLNVAKPLPQQNEPYYSRLGNEGDEGNDRWIWIPYDH